MFSQITDHAAQMVANLILALRKPRLEALLTDVLGPALQEVEDEAFGFLAGRDVLTAVGAQLDIIGRIVGLARQGWGDDRYRAYLLAQIAIRYSRGNGDRLLDVLAILSQTEGLTYLFEVYPAQVQMEYDGPLYPTEPEWAADLVTFLERAACPGVLVGPMIERDPDSFRFSVAGAGFSEGEFGTRVG